MTLVVTERTVGVRSTMTIVTSYMRRSVILLTCRLGTVFSYMETCAAPGTVVQTARSLLVAVGGTRVRWDPGTVGVPTAMGDPLMVFLVIVPVHMVPKRRNAPPWGAVFLKPLKPVSYWPTLLAATLVRRHP